MAYLLHLLLRVIVHPVLQCIALCRAVLMQTAGANC
jgi:hypothetical protein